MKRLLAMILCLFMLTSLVACGHTVSEEEARNELRQGVADLKRKINSQNIVAVDARVFTDGDGTRWLLADIKNEVIDEIDISELVVAFFAWDENGSPVYIKTEKQPDSTYYLFEMSLEKTIVIPGGETWKADAGLRLSEACDDICYVEAIAVSGVICGKAWENPCYDTWYEIYHTQSLEDWQMADMKPADGGDDTGGVILEPTEGIVDDGDEITEEYDPQQEFAQMQDLIQSEDVYVTAASVYMNSETEEVFLTANIKNSSEEKIGDVTIAFAAWDADGNPVLIKSASGRTEDSYVKGVGMGDIEISAGEEWLGDTEDDVYGLRLDPEQTNIAYVEAIVVSYTSQSGEEWENPFYYSWRNAFEGKQLEDWMRREPNS